MVEAPSRAATVAPGDKRANDDETLWLITILGAESQPFVRHPLRDDGHVPGGKTTRAAASVHFVCVRLVSVDLAGRGSWMGQDRYEINSRVRTFTASV